MIAEEFLLCKPTVDVKQQWILVERDLRGDADDYVLLDERAAVYLIIWQSSLRLIDQFVLEVLQIPCQVVPELPQQLQAGLPDALIGGEHVILDGELQEDGKLPDDLFDLIPTVYDVDGSQGVRMIGSSGAGLSLRMVGEDIDKFLTAILDDLLRTQLFLDLTMLLPALFHTRNSHFQMIIITEMSGPD